MACPPTTGPLCEACLKGRLTASALRTVRQSSSGSRRGTQSRMARGSSRRAKPDARRRWVRNEGSEGRACAPLFFYREALASALGRSLRGRVMRAGRAGAAAAATALVAVLVHGSMLGAAGLAVGWRLRPSSFRRGGRRRPWRRRRRPPGASWRAGRNRLRPSRPRPSSCGVVAVHAGLVTGGIVVLAAGLLCRRRDLRGLGGLGGLARRRRPAHPPRRRRRRQRVRPKARANSEMAIFLACMVEFFLGPRADPVQG